MTPEEEAYAAYELSVNRVQQEVKAPQPERRDVKKVEKKPKAAEDAVEKKAAKEEEEDLCAAQTKDVDELLKNTAEKGLTVLEIVYRNVLIFSLLHIAAIVGAACIPFAKYQTLLFTFYMYFHGAMGITAGAHRLWSHRTFKARAPLRLYLMIGNCIALQNDVIEWARDHRCHHKWTDTEADPHNSSRGFFYSHVGWLLARKTEQLKKKGSTISMADLENDWVLRFQRKNYIILVLLCCFAIPTFIPVFFWGESPFIALYICGVFRYVFTLNVTWLINSASHMWGYKPYDKSVTPVENMWTNVFAMGEGGHNYHHTFPQDYRTSELPYMTNWTRGFLDLMALVGQVYDRKTVTEEVIARQAKNKGDGNRSIITGNSHH